MSNSKGFVTAELQSHLEEKVRGYMSDKRYKHTLGVANASLVLAEYFPSVSPRDAYIAAMLHDISKEMSTEEQMLLIEKYSVKVDAEDLKTKEAIHSFSAAAVIQRDFSDYASEEILSAVSKHTLGGCDMTLLDKIIFISDYIEEGRTANSCKAVREYLLGALQKNDMSVSLLALNKSIIMAIDYTEEYLSSLGKAVNQRSLRTKEFLRALN